METPSVEVTLLRSRFEWVRDAMWHLPSRLRKEMSLTRREALCWRVFRGHQCGVDIAIGMAALLVAGSHNIGIPFGRR